MLNQLMLVLPIKPVPASRPRVTARGVFYQKTYRQYRKQAKDDLFNQVALLCYTKDEPVFPKGTPVISEVSFNIPAAKTTKRDWPQGDLDNLEKALYDSITDDKRIWHDDDQLVKHTTAKVYLPPGSEGCTTVYLRAASDRELQSIRDNQDWRTKDPDQCPACFHELVV